MCLEGGKHMTLKIWFSPAEEDGITASGHSLPNPVPGHPCINSLHLAGAAYDKCTGCSETGSLNFRLSMLAGDVDFSSIAYLGATCIPEGEVPDNAEGIRRI